MEGTRRLRAEKAARLKAPGLCPAKAFRKRAKVRGAMPGSGDANQRRMFMTETFMPDFADADALRAHQLKGLQWTVGHAYGGSEFYRQRLEAAGVGPGDIRSLADIEKLPLTAADDLRTGYPVSAAVRSGLRGGAGACLFGYHGQKEGAGLYPERYR